MKTGSTTFTGNNTTTIVFGLLAALLVFTVLTGRKLPLIGSDRAALVLLVVLGMAMCMNGIGRVAAAGAWRHPLAILGSLLGALILVVGVTGFFGWQVPLVSGARQAIIAVSALAVVKLGLSLLHRLL
jgi:hypothetical protein